MNRRRAPPESRLLYRATGLLLLTLWLSGLIWLALHYLVAKPDDFGVAHHPLEGSLLLVHGIAALATLFVLGWFASRHAGAVSGRGSSRVSGWLFTGLLVLLAVAGCAQFFLISERWQAAAKLTHEICGVALLLPALMHLVRFRSADRRALHDEDPERRHHGRRHGSARPHSVRN
jgi:hypothetical protein